MAVKLVLENKKIRAEIAPYNGGMISSLKVSGREVLRMDDGKLDVIPMLSGGIPVLFPFPSRTVGDEYAIEGKTYAMPFHGLVKNCAFGVAEASETFVKLFIENNAAWEKSLYPYPFRLELTYSLTEGGIKLEADVINTGKGPLYHAFSWHPFFLATDRSRVKLTHTYKYDYDYDNHRDRGPAPQNMDLTQLWDHVFHTPENSGFVLENRQEGYIANVSVDESFPVLVVCTTQDNAVCVEPWSGLPGTANTKTFGHTVAAGESGHSEMTILLEDI